MTAPDPRLEEIEGRLSKATPGPWRAGQGATSDGSELCTTHEQKAAFLALSLHEDGQPLWLVDNAEVIPAVTGDGPRAQANAEFIAAAPADVAYLLAELRKAQDKLARVEGLIERAMAQPAYLLPGGYPSKPVEAYALRAAVADATGGGE